ncbi:M28 family peptidase [Sphingopyxis sp. MWB1]|uniref:M28 family peptidase n=1 Tax=Sphingopyxis sp. MWB1 TaxID=1537715 RepID=UPI000AFC2023|nr:M28 family peptidase [Sphingopyxis sp. MWB1]
MKKPTFRAALAASALIGLAVPAIPAAFAAPVAADTPITEAELAAHIRVLASDAFEGRAPGTAGEDRTIAYIAGEWARAGLEPVKGSDTPWLQPVPLVESRSLGGEAQFRAKGRAIRLDPQGLLLNSRDAEASLDNLPVMFVGYGVDAEGNVTADVAGKAAIMFFENPPYGKDLPRYRERRRMLAEAGAKAVLVVAPEALGWERLRGAMSAASIERVQESGEPAISGFLSQAAADTLFKQAGFAVDPLRQAASDPGYRGAALPLTADLSARTEVRAFDSHNVIARLPGANPDGKAVLFLGHWDHLGLCAPEGAADRICNGAVDNASGIAVLIEVAKRLAKGPRPDRDIYFLATTAEEKGLLGAYHFADHPAVPLSDITVALNLDTVAISPRGTPVATIGRGRPAHDALVTEVATRLGRKIDSDGEADPFVQRQDGWALGAKGVASLMVGGSFSDMALLEAFLGDDYHGPGDEFSDKIPLGGAAEDADLHVALGRAFADKQRWPGTGD